MGMEAAVRKLQKSLKHDGESYYVLVDGNRVPKSLPSDKAEPVVKADWLAHREEEKKVYWVMAMRFPIDASMYIRSGIEMVMGKITKDYDIINDPIDPNLGNIKFGLHPNAEEKFVRSLKVFTAKGYLTGDLVNSNTPWCSGCKRYIRLEGDCLCEDDAEGLDKAAEGADFPSGPTPMEHVGRPEKGKQHTSAPPSKSSSSQQQLKPGTNPKHSADKGSYGRSVQWLNPQLLTSSAGAKPQGKKTGNYSRKQGEHASSNLGLPNQSKPVSQGPSWLLKIPTIPASSQAACPLPPKGHGQASAGTVQSGTTRQLDPNDRSGQGRNVPLAAGGALTDGMDLDRFLRTGFPKRSRQEESEEDRMDAPARGEEGKRNQQSGAHIAVPVLLKTTNQGPYMLLLTNQQGSNFYWAPLSWFKESNEKERLIPEIGDGIRVTADWKPEEYLRRKLRGLHNVGTHRSLLIEAIPDSWKDKLSSAAHGEVGSRWRDQDNPSIFYQVLNTSSDNSAEVSVWRQRNSLLYRSNTDSEHISLSSHQEVRVSQTTNKQGRQVTMPLKGGSPFRDWKLDEVKDSQGKPRTLTARDTRWGNWLEHRVWQIKHLRSQNDNRWKTGRELRATMKGCHKLTENLNDVLISILQEWTQLLRGLCKWEWGDWATWHISAVPKQAFRVQQEVGPDKQWLDAEMFVIRNPGIIVSHLDKESKTAITVKKCLLRKIRVVEDDEFTVFAPTVAIEDLEYDTAEWAWNIRGGETRVATRINILRYTTRMGYRLRRRLTQLDLPLALRWEKREGIPRDQGDGKCHVIAAASIIAKVTRDRMMAEFDRKWPEYGFKAHKGYGTAAHMAAIKTHGPCEIHRRTFAPINKYV
ncbi:hypothetical protein CBR_g37722 [Chara braunii]|uniref:Ribonuclease n=1 Tax=Chara braunii TaxID=69332 RepID=A0A388K017_CHABU|nr:hypothetical protein CBR_g37722 [Chara braunii]|eukprot:GBG63365.1 hypothetical protein CBR_g37722 [Chara braunii]